MNYEGKSVFQLVEAKEDPQVAINTVNIAANAANIAASTGKIALLQSNVRAGLSGSYFGSYNDTGLLNRLQYSSFPIDAENVAWPNGLGLEEALFNSYPAVLAGTYATSPELYPVSSDSTIFAPFSIIRHQPVDTSQVYRYVFDWEVYYGITRVDSNPVGLGHRILIKLYDTTGVFLYTLQGKTNEYSLEQPIGTITPFYVTQKIAYSLDWRLYPTAVYADVFLSSFARPLFPITPPLPFKVDALWNKEGTRRNCFHVEVFKSR